MLRAAFVEQVLWVAVDRSGTPVGQLTGVEGPDGLLIAQIDVLPEYQRQGHGRRLIAAAEAEARSRDLPFLWLRTFRDIPWNAPFYRSLGFEETEGALWRPDGVDVVTHERESGLDPATRVTMVKPLS